MKKRSADILQKIILTKSKKINVVKLANEYQVSERTLRNDIKEINRFLDRINTIPIEFDKDGNIRLTNKMDVKKIEKSLYEMDIYSYKLSSKERKMYIIISLIQKEKYTTMEKISEELYVSRVTIISDFEAVKDILKEYNIELISQSGKGISLSGNEKNIRILLMKIFRQIMGNVISDGYFQRLIIAKLGLIYYLSEIVTIMQGYQKNKNIVFTDFVFYEIIIYLFISLNRIKKQKIVNCPKTRIFTENKEAIEILSFFQKKLCLIIPQEEFQAMAEYMRGNHLKPIKKSINDIELLGTIGFFLSKVGKVFEIDFQLDSMLMESLLLHIKTMKNWNNIKMDFIEEMSLPIEYHELLIEVEKKSDILEKYLGYSLNQNMKISIVIHICAALVRNRSYTFQLSVLIACPGSMATGKFLEAQIKNQFDFNIKGVIAVPNIFDELVEHENKIDFVISTVEVPQLKCPIIIVNPLLTMEDLNIIQQLAFVLGQRKTLKTRKTKIGIIKKIENSLNDIEDINVIYNQIEDVIDSHVSNVKDSECLLIKDLLHYEDIRIEEEEINWKESIKRAGTILEQQDYFESVYIDAMIENINNYGPYIMISPGVALAHANKDFGVKKDGMSLLVSKKGVKFEEKTAHLIFCFCAKEDKDYLSLFKQIIKIGTEQGKLEKICSLTTKKEIKENLG